MSAFIRCQRTGEVVGSSFISAQCGCGKDDTCRARAMRITADRTMLAAMSDTDSAEKPLDKRQKVARDVGRVVDHLREGHTTPAENKKIGEALERSNSDKAVGRALKPF